MDKSAAEAIQWRLILPMVNEAAKLLAEGVTDSADAIDLATVLGTGLAPFRGGLARFADTAGIDKVVAKMDELAQRTAPASRPRRCCGGWPRRIGCSASSRLGRPVPRDASATLPVTRASSPCSVRRSKKNRRLPDQGAASTGWKARVTLAGCHRPQDKDASMPTFKRRDQEQIEKAKDLLETAPAELGFVKSLFFGRLKLDEVLPYPQQSAEEAARTDEMLAKIDAVPEGRGGRRPDRRAKSASRNR